MISADLSSVFSLALAMNETTPSVSQLRSKIQFDSPVLAEIFPSSEAFLILYSSLYSPPSALIANGSSVVIMISGAGISSEMISGFGSLSQLVNSRKIG